MVKITTGFQIVGDALASHLV